jgi:hypothetical protein
LKAYEPLERGQIICEAINRLTSLEFFVLEGLLEKRERHAKLSGAEFSSVMSETERAFEAEWIRITRSIIREREEGLEGGEERREELRKRRVEEFESDPPVWLWLNERDEQ